MKKYPIKNGNSFVISMNIILSMIFFFISCAKKEQFSLREQASSLYKESCELLELYTDSMSIAKDSLAVEGLEFRLDDKLAKINFRYPPNTDLEISEDENSNIIKLTDRYVSIRDSLLYRFAHPVELLPDSLLNASDTIVAK